MRKMVFLIVVLIINNLCSANSWYDQKLEGWYYFEDKGNSKQKQHSLTKQEAEEILEEEKASLKQQLALALLSPTEENVEAYLKEQKKWIDQSSRFANVWQKTLLEHPLLGDFLINPTTSFGVQLRKDLEVQKRKKRLTELAKTHFLLFFFKGKDPYSQKAAEVVHLFSTMNQWKVKAVSIDYVPVKEFPEFEIDKGISRAVKAKITPSMYVVDPSQDLIIPVGAGLISVSELEANIEAQIYGSASELTTFSSEKNIVKGKLCSE